MPYVGTCMTFQVEIPFFVNHEELNNLKGGNTTFVALTLTEPTAYFIVKASKKVNKRIPLLLQPKENILHLSFFKHTGEVFEEKTLGEDVIEQVKHYVRSLSFNKEIFFKILVKNINEKDWYKR